MKIFLQFAFIISTFFATLGCDQLSFKNNSHPIKPYKLSDSLLGIAKDGDLVVRMGRDDISQFFSKMNRRNKSFSHCGLLHKTDGGLFVYHIIATMQNPNGKIVYEPLQQFINSNENKAWALVRYDSMDVSLLWQQIDKLIKAKITFDYQFDLETKNKQYCTELIYNCITNAGVSENCILKDVSMDGKLYIAVDALFENNCTKGICQIEYK